MKLREGTQTIKITFVLTYLSQKCGIATCTDYLIRGIEEVDPASDANSSLCSFGVPRNMEKGWKRKAIKHSGKFLDLWKDVDRGIAEVEDAKKRLARLKSQ